jgi:hypothetical protein
MTEMIGVTVTAGGSVTRQTWREFMRDMAATGFRFDVVGGQLHFSDEANYGNTDQVQAACRAHGVAYNAANDAKYEISGQVTAWFPDMAQPHDARADQEGNPLISLATLATAHACGAGLSSILAEYAAHLRKVPPMLIDGAPATNADLDDVADEEEA